jgi:hypothetical protein
MRKMGKVKSKSDASPKERLFYVFWRNAVTAERVCVEINERYTICILILFSACSETKSLGARLVSSALYKPRMMMSMEQLVEWELVGETEVLGGNLSQRRFSHSKSYKNRPQTEPGSPQWKAAN